MPTSVSLDALITKTLTQMGSEQDPDKLAELAATLGGYTATKRDMASGAPRLAAKGKATKSEEDDSEEATMPPEKKESKGDETDRDADDPDDQGDDDDNGDGKKKKASNEEDEGEEEATVEEDEGEGEEESKGYEEAEEESAKDAATNLVRAMGLKAPETRKALHRGAYKAILNVLRESAAHKVYEAAVKITGKTSAIGVISALQGNATGAKELKERVAAIEADNRLQRKSSLIEKALGARRITRSEASQLRKKNLAFVESYLEMRPAPLVRTSDDEHVQPNGAAHPGRGDTPREGKTPIQVGANGKVTDPLIAKEIRKAVAGAKASGIKDLAKYESDLIEALQTGGAKVRFPQV